MKYTYYALPLHDLRPDEFPEDIGSFMIKVEKYAPGEDGNSDPIEIVDVEVVAPISYTLVDMDYARIDELVNSNAP